MGGETHYYLTTDGESLNRFNNDFWNNITKPMAWEVALRVRMTEGWEKKINGNFHFKVTDLMTTGPVDQ